MMCALAHSQRASAPVCGSQPLCAQEEELDQDEAALERALGGKGKRKRGVSAAEMRYEDFFGSKQPPNAPRAKGAAKGARANKAVPPAEAERALAPAPDADAVAAVEEEEEEDQTLSTHERRAKRC